MKSIIHDIITSEKCLLNVALVLYRDHPPQDSSFVIQVYNFTDDAEEAKKNIDRASASGGEFFDRSLSFLHTDVCVHLGGDGPEAVAPALHAAVHTLSWRKTAVKVALLIADAPPHGLETAGDGFPNGNDDALLFFVVISRILLRWSIRTWPDGVCCSTCWK